MKVQSSPTHMNVCAAGSDEVVISIDQRFLICALVYAVAGMSLGLSMAVSQKHAQFITHAHALLVGFVVSLLYATIHRLWLAGDVSRLARFQFFVHQAGAATMVIGLFALFDGSVPQRVVEPILGAASTAVLLGALLMLLLVVRFCVRSSRLRRLSARSLEPPRGDLAS